MNSINSEINREKLQELQMIEQHLQSFMAQKQSCQIELNEAENALVEIKKAGNEIYKIIGNIMLKSNSDEIKKELEEKKKLLNMRVSSMEKQEKLLESKANELKKELTSQFSKEKKQ